MTPEQTLGATSGLKSSGIRPWLLALRPKTLTASVVPILVATALIKHEGAGVLWWVSICAMLSSVFIQIGTNLVNDAIDFKKGADTVTRTGPRRVTQSGLLTPRQVMTGATAFFALAFTLGIPLVMHGGWPIVAIGLVSLALGYAYTGGPFPLAYKGLGDFFVVLFFGVIAVGGTYYLHAGRVSEAAMVAGVQIGLLAAVLIAINNLRDAPQDSTVGKKTLAVRYGVEFARAEIAMLTIAPFLLGMYWAKYGPLNAGILPILAVPVARRIVMGVYKNEPGAIYNHYLALAALLHLLFGALLSLALWTR